jgi:hypothetical protein
MRLESERLMQADGILGDGAFSAFAERGAAVNRLLEIANHASGLGWGGILANDEPRLASPYFFAARSLIKAIVQQAHSAHSTTSSTSCRTIWVCPRGTA